MSQYIAVIRAVFSADDDADAVMISEKIRENGETELEIDEGDSIDVAQVVSNALELEPEEAMVVMRRARNQLIRTRTRWGIDLARDLDQAIHKMRYKIDDTTLGPPYDYGKFMDLLNNILTLRENPLD